MRLPKRLLFIFIFLVFILIILFNKSYSGGTSSDTSTPYSLYSFIVGNDRTDPSLLIGRTATNYEDRWHYTCLCQHDTPNVADKPLRIFNVIDVTKEGDVMVYSEKNPKGISIPEGLDKERLVTLAGHCKRHTDGIDSEPRIHDAYNQWQGDWEKFGLLQVKQNFYRSSFEDRYPLTERNENISNYVG